MKIHILETGYKDKRMSEIRNERLEKRLMAFGQSRIIETRDRILYTCLQLTSAQFNWLKHSFTWLTPHPVTQLLYESSHRTSVKIYRNQVKVLCSRSTGRLPLVLPGLPQVSPSPSLTCQKGPFSLQASCKIFEQSEPLVGIHDTVGLKFAEWV